MESKNTSRVYNGIAAENSKRYVHCHRNSVTVIPVTVIRNSVTVIPNQASGKLRNSICSRFKSLVKIVWLSIANL